MSADLPETQSIVVAEEQAGMRVDALIAKTFPQISRAKIQRSIRKSLVTIDGESAKPSHRVKVNQTVQFELPPVESDAPIAEDIPLDILFEDDHIVAINKPPAMVVHPAKGHWSGTLTAALAFHFQQLSSLGGAHRPGIVHRLDRDTSGVILVAKSDESHRNLSSQFEKRTIQKEYLALVSPAPDRDRELVKKPIGVHPYQREKMAIREDHSKSRDAETFFEIQDRMRGFAVVLCKPKTGRTHQIRVHLAHWGCPVLADRLYSGRSKVQRCDISKDKTETEVLLDRQALHAHQISFAHPINGAEMTIQAPLAEDIKQTIEVLKEYR
jgi:23S rRNA pseudouridine1911/1915/1917 synthase